MKAANETSWYPHIRSFSQYNAHSHMLWSDKIPSVGTNELNWMGKPFIIELNRKEGGCGFFDLLNKVNHPEPATPSLPLSRSSLRPSAHKHKPGIPLYYFRILCSYSSTKHENNTGESLAPAQASCLKNIHKLPWIIPKRLMWHQHNGQIIGDI